MPYRQEAQLAFGQVEIIGDAIITHPQFVAAQSLQARVRMVTQARAQFVDFNFYSRPEFGGQLEEIRVEIPRVNLRRAHDQPL
jgi:hypothetical protein